MIPTIFARRGYILQSYSIITRCAYIYIYHWRVDSHVILPFKKANYAVFIILFLQYVSSFRYCIHVFNHTLDFVHSMKNSWWHVLVNIFYIYIYGWDIYINIFLIRWNFEVSKVVIHLRVAESDYSRVSLNWKKWTLSYF